MQPIIQHLFQVSSLEDVSRQRLESFVAEYPSFGIGHYLLSRKLLAEGADNYIEETQRTNLYFTNPFWLQWLLDNPEEPAAGKVLETQVARVVEAPVAEPVVEEPVVEEPVVEEPVVEPVKDTMDVAVEEALMQGHEHEPERASLVSIAETAAAADGAEQPDSMVALAEKLAAEPEPTAAELLLQSIEEARGLRESIDKIHEDFGVVRQPVEEPIKDEETAFVLEEDAAAEGPVAAGEGSVAAGEPVAELRATEPAQTAEAEAEAKPTEQGYIFEPYHTIDYFASQGIKLHLEENPSDQLGKQLKSFTEWLKTMRKLPQKEREVLPDQVAEQTIQTIAAHSVVGKEVVTETMAEVLAKQGMPERAKALYEKLSLLDPDKKAYFAAKIEQLNSH
ncbi:hypothetical protein ACQ86N_17075 [Puia sp. P3]|uniref:hypothetical protein n=1 Tax=Puia sp. P3 TaxID=3423952 RepID=UPI003D67FC4E